MIFIVNPRAGRGRGEAIARELPARLARHGLTGRVVTTAGPRAAVALAREAARDESVVVAVGGDGTANEVVNGLAESDATFGLLPVGSGNDLALALGIPDDLDEALEVIAHGRDSRLDLGRYDDGWFANSLGIGFEAQVTIESHKVKRLRGFSVYLWAALMALRKLHCSDFVLHVDGERIEGRRLLVCVGNGPRVGGGFLLTPAARPFDGFFDLCLVEAMGRWTVLKTLPKAIQGTHTGHPAVRMLQARTLEIESTEGFPFHVDGEVMDTNRKKLRVEIRPGLLKVRQGRTKGDGHG
jgi:YegS/Rv2252/BmrU family lipid kinase